MGRAVRHGDVQGERIILNENGETRMTEVIKFEKKPANGMMPQTIEQADKIATIIASSNLAPKDFKGKPADTLVAVMMGMEIGLNPMQAVQNIAVINGRPTLWGDAMLALVQGHPAFLSIEETLDKSTMTATCIVTRKGGKPHVSTFSQENAKKAGLWAKQGPWTQYPEVMLKMRARGFALRDQFSDALKGISSAEEQRDIIDITPVAPEATRMAHNPPVMVAEPVPHPSAPSLDQMSPEAQAYFNQQQENAVYEDSCIAFETLPVEHYAIVKLYNEMGATWVELMGEKNKPMLTEIKELFFAAAKDAGYPQVKETT